MIDSGLATIETLDDGRVKVSLRWGRKGRMRLTLQSEDAMQLGRALVKAANHAERPARRTVRKILRGASR